MPHNVFISYPTPSQDIVENFAYRLEELGVSTWVYSRDRTLAEDIWEEIEEKIKLSDLFIFIVSPRTANAEGQDRELELALTKITEGGGEFRMIPIVVHGGRFSDLPEVLRRVNGESLDCYTVSSTACKIAETFFPDLVESSGNEPWKCPRPGQWLEVCHINYTIEEFFEAGDRVYFRRLSPLGLFECYAPKINGLFWFAPQHLKASGIVDEGGALERTEVPHSYRYATSYEYERVGMDQARERGELD